METELEKATRLGYCIGTPPEGLLAGSTSFASTLYHQRDDLPGKRAGMAKFFDAQSGQNGIGIGETNMSRGGTLDKGYKFTIQKIGVKVSQRSAAASSEVKDKLWYQRILQTLFRYAVLRFNIGPVYIGEFRLSQLLPSVQSVGQAIVDADDASPSSSASPLMSAGVFDLDRRPITLSENVNFSVDIQWDIPNRVWDAKLNSYKSLDPTEAKEAELMELPADTLVETQLIGVAHRSI